MSTRYKVSILCALATPLVLLIVAGIGMYFDPSPKAASTLFTFACHFVAPLWFIYWIKRVGRKGKPLWFEVHYVG